MLTLTGLITLFAIVFWVKVFNWLCNWTVRMYARAWKDLGKPKHKVLKEVELDPERVLKK